MKPERAIAFSLAALALALPVSIAGANAAAGALTAALAWRAAAGRQRWQALRSPVVLALALYALAGLVCGLLGLDPAASLARLPRDLHKLWLAAILCLALRDEPFPEAPAWLAAGFTVACCFGLGRSLGGIAAGEWTRAKAFVHPVTFGDQLAFGLLGALCLVSSRASLSPRRRRAVWCFLVLAAATFACNQTRGALLSLCAGLFAAARLDAGFKRSVLPKALVGAFLILLSWEAFSPGYRTLRHIFFHEAGVAAAAEDSAFSRYALWDAAWRMFKDHPLTGVGPGAYRAQFPLYHRESLKEKGDVWGNAHNLYLHILAERGLLGFSALALVLGAMALTAWRRARRAPGAGTLCAAAALPLFIVMNATEVAFQNELLFSLVLFIWAWGSSREKGAA